jgi:hypothetical protein
MIQKIFEYLTKVRRDFGNFMFKLKQLSVSILNPFALDDDEA